MEPVGVDLEALADQINSLIGLVGTQHASILKMAAQMDAMEKALSQLNEMGPEVMQSLMKMISA
jgi:hypothetical protein